MPDYVTTLGIDIGLTQDKVDCLSRFSTELDKVAPRSEKAQKATDSFRNSVTSIVEQLHQVQKAAAGGSFDAIQKSILDLDRQVNIFKNSLSGVLNSLNEFRYSKSIGLDKGLLSDIKTTVDALDTLTSRMKEMARQSALSGQASTIRKEAEKTSQVLSTAFSNSERSSRGILSSLTQSHGLMYNLLGMMGGFRLASAGRVAGQALGALGGAGIGISEIAAIAAPIGIAVAALVSFYEALKVAIPAIDEFRRTTASLAGNMTDTYLRPGMTQEEIKQAYISNRGYSANLVPMVELTAARYGIGKQGINNALSVASTKGLMPTGEDEASLQKSVDSMMVAIAKIQSLTIGQNQGVQLSQELRALADGSARVTDQFSIMMKTALGPEWKQMIQDAINFGDVWSLLADKLGGTKYAMEDLANTVSSQWARIGTSIMQILRNLFTDLYDWIVGIMKPIADWFEERAQASNKDAAVQRLAKQGVLKEEHFVPMLGIENGKVVEISGGGTSPYASQLNPAGEAVLNQFYKPSVGKKLFVPEKVDEFQGVSTATGALINELKKIRAKKEVLESLQRGADSGKATWAPDEEEKAHRDYSDLLIQEQEAYQKYAKTMLTERKGIEKLLRDPKSTDLNSRIQDVHDEYKTIRDELTLQIEKYNLDIQRPSADVETIGKNLGLAQDALSKLPERERSAISAVEESFRKKGITAGNRAESYAALQDRLRFEGLKQGASARGDTLMAGIYGAEESYRAKVKDIENQARTGGFDKDQALILEKTAERAKIESVISEETKKQVSAYASMGAALSSLTGNPYYKMQGEVLKAEQEYGAVKQSNMAKDVEAAIAQKDSMIANGQYSQQSIDNITQIISLKQQELDQMPKMLALAKVKAEVDAQSAKYKQAQQLAELSGNPQVALDMQIRELENQKKLNTENEIGLRLLDEQIRRLKARRDMNVGGLIQSGLADAETKAWNDLADKIGNSIPSLVDNFGQAISGGLSDLISGTKDAATAFKDMGKSISKAVIQMVIDIGVLIMKVAIFKSLLGYNVSVPSMSTAGMTGLSAGDVTPDATSSLTGGAESYSAQFERMAGTTGGGSGDTLKKFAGYGLDTVKYANSNLVSSTSTLTATQAAALEAANPAFVGPSVNLAPAGVPGSAAPATSMLGSALGGGAVGYTIGNLLRPDVPMIGLASGAVGAVTAAAASSSAVMGAIGMTAMGTLAATGVGAVAAAAIGAITAIATPNTVTKSKTGETGVTVGYGAGLTPQVQGYEVWRKTTSGMFGSSSTSHYATPSVATAKDMKTWTDAMDPYSNFFRGLSGQSLGLKTSHLSDFMWPEAFPVSSNNASEMAYNISNAMALKLIQKSGKEEEYFSVMKENETYIDLVQRLTTAMEEGGQAAELAGLDLQKFTGEITKVGQAAKMSGFAEAFGGMSNLTSFFQRYAKLSMSDDESMNTVIDVYTRNLAESLSELPGVTVGTFFDKWKAAMQSPNMSPDELVKWDAPSKWYEKLYDTYQKQAQLVQQEGQQQIQIIQAQMSSIQTQRQAVQELHDAWSEIVDLVAKTMDDLRFDSNLTNLSPYDRYMQARVKMVSLGTAGAAGDQASAKEFASFAKEFLTISKEYWGATPQYYQDYEVTMGLLQETKDYAQLQYDIATQQLAVLDKQLAVLDAQVVAINNNTNALVAAISNLQVKLGGSPYNSYTSSSSSGGSGGSVDTSFGMGGSGTNYAGETFIEAYTRQLANGGPSAEDWANFYKLQGLDSGGRFGPGAFVTGETGPELVNFASAGRVYNTGETNDINENLSNINRTQALGFSEMVRELKSNTQETAAMRRELIRQSAAPRG